MPTRRLSRTGPPRMGPVGIARRRRPCSAEAKGAAYRGGTGRQFGKLCFIQGTNRKGGPMPYTHLSPYERGKIHLLSTHVYTVIP